MDDRQRIEQALRAIVELLVREDYEEVARLTGGRRLRAEEIQDAVHEYGRTLDNPPPFAFSHADVICIQGSIPTKYSVRFRLYTKEEGLSDLELQATLGRREDSEAMSVQLDNILVA